MSKPDEIRTDGRVQTFCLLTLTLIALGVASYLLRPVLVPFVLAVFLTYCLTPLIDAQQRYLRLPRVLAIVSAVVLALLVLAVCGSVVATSINSASLRLQDYDKQFRDLTERVTSSVPLERLGIRTDAEQIRRFLAAQESNGFPPQFLDHVLLQLCIRLHFKTFHRQRRKKSRRDPTPKGVQSRRLTR